MGGGEEGYVQYLLYLEVVALYDQPIGRQQIPILCLNIKKIINFYNKIKSPRKAKNKLIVICYFYKKKSKGSGGFKNVNIGTVYA